MINGVRMLSIEEMARAMVDLGIEDLIVFAVMDDTNTCFAFDYSRFDNSMRSPIVRIPAGVTPPVPRNRDPFRKDKSLEKALGLDVAAHLGDFLRKLASPKHRLGG